MSEDIELEKSSEVTGNKAKKGLIATFWQFIKFGIVGVSNTAVAMLVNAISLYLFYKLGGIPESNKISYWTSSILSWLISVLNAFYWSNRYVFKNKEGEQRVWWKVLIKTYISYAWTGLILSNILIWVWNDVVHIGRYFGWLADLVQKFGIEMTGDRIVSYIAVFLNMMITIPMNFVINKFWAYKGKKKKEEV